MSMGRGYGSLSSPDAAPDEIKIKKDMNTKNTMCRFTLVAGVFLTVSLLPILAADNSRTNAPNRAFPAPPRPGGASGGFGQIEQARKVIGREVRGAQNEKLGKVDELVLDLESGRLLYAVVSVNGSRLGVPPQVFSQSAE